MSRFVADSKLGLGTVQWGCDYGVSNQSGKTGLEDVAAILARAKDSNVNILDTASLYGDAETVLGFNDLSGFNVVTKTPRFVSKTIGDAHVLQLRATYFASLSKMRVSEAYGLLVHGATDLLVPGAHLILAELRDLKDKGLVERIGVSIYDRYELDAVLSVWTPDIVQLPLSVFDQRLIASGHLKRLKDLGVEVHVRSVFLQGLLLMPLQVIPTYFGPIMDLITRWHAEAREQSMTLSGAALTFVRDLPEVDRVFVGVENLSQFEEILSGFSMQPAFRAEGFACPDEIFLNPGLWNIQK